jgi:hypothetical protein
VALVLAGIGAGAWLAWTSRSASRPAVTRARPARPAARPSPAPRLRSVEPVARVTSQPLPESSTVPAPPPEPPGPRVAIVFDDAGGSVEDVEAIIAIRQPVTVAVLPDLPYSSEVARRARAAGLEVLLHLPLESGDDSRPLGPGGITIDMDDATIRATVRRGLDSVPGAVGVNNHMGSRGATDRRVMRAVLEVVKAEGLFFLDSRTTAETVGEALAGEMGIKTGRRHIFLDNVDEEPAIRHEIERLIGMARARGAMIAIGHAHRLTPRIVAAMREEFPRHGVTLVPLSTLMR